MINSADSLSALLQFIQNSRRKILQLQFDSPEDRIALLRALADELEKGREVWSAAEAEDCDLPLDFVRSHSVDFAIQLMRQNFSLSVESRPRGLLSLMAPKRLGFYNSFARLVPALLRGNYVVLGSSVKDLAVATFLRAASEISPKIKEALLVVDAADDSIQEILLFHPSIQGLSFWGNSQSLESVQKKLRWNVPFTWNIGGTSAAIVLDEASLAAALSEILDSAQVGMGQLPWNPSRIILMNDIEESFYTELANQLSDRSKRKADDGTKKLDAQLTKRLRLLKAKGSEILGQGPGPYFVKDFSLCSELRFEGVELPVIFVDTIKYAYEINKKIQPMDQLCSVQLWGEAEKVTRIQTKVDCGLIYLNETFLSPGKMLLSRDAKVRSALSDTDFESNFFSR